MSRNWKILEMEWEIYLYTAMNKTDLEYFLLSLCINRISAEPNMLTTKSMSTSYNLVMSKGDKQQSSLLVALV